MTSQGAAGSSSNSDDEVSVFCDTGILINYVNTEWERDHTSDLLENYGGELVISETVEDEFIAVTDRRESLYTDFLEYVLHQEGAVEEYSPRIRVESNDYSHIQGIQQQLANEDKREVARRLRRFDRMYSEKIDFILSDFIDEVVFTAPPLPLTFALSDVISNSDDATIVSEAADWANEGGSGHFSSLDKNDILDLAREINEAIANEFSPMARLTILHPKDVVSE